MRQTAPKPKGMTSWKDLSTSFFTALGGSLVLFGAILAYSTMYLEYSYPGLRGPVSLLPALPDCKELPPPAHSGDSVGVLRFKVRRTTPPAPPTPLLHTETENGITAVTYQGRACVRAAHGGDLTCWPIPEFSQD